MTLDFCSRVRFGDCSDPAKYRRQGGYGFVGDKASGGATGFHASLPRLLQTCQELASLRYLTLALEDSEDFLVPGG